MDPQQQQALNQFAGLGAGVLAFAMLFGLAILGFIIFLFWRTFTKAGLAGPLALLVLIPGIGWLIVLCILAFSEWKVVPAASQYTGMMPPYPPSGYPPAGPPSYTRQGPTA